MITDLASPSSTISFGLYVSSSFHINVNFCELNVPGRARFAAPFSTEKKIKNTFIIRPKCKMPQRILGKECRPLTVKYPDAYAIASCMQLQMEFEMV